MKNWNKDWIFLGIILSIYTFLGSFFAIYKWEHFLYKQLDLSIFVNSLKQPWSDFLYSTIQGHNYLGDHFMPFLVLIKPIFDLFTQSPLVLLIIGILLIASWFIPIYLIAKNILGEYWAKWITVFFALSPAILTINLYEFHPESIGILLMLWAFYFFVTNDYKRYAIFFILALISREDAFLFLIPFSFLALLEKRSKKWWLLPIIGLIYSLIAYKMVGYFNPSGGSIFFKYYGWLGTSLPQIIWIVTTQPWRLMGRLLYFDFFSFSLQGLMFSMFLPLMKFRYLLFGLLPYAAIVFGPGQSVLLYRTHYAMPVIAGIVIAAIYGLKKLIDPNNGIFKNDIILLKTLLIVSIIFLNISYGPYLTFWKQIHSRFEEEKALSLSNALSQIDLGKATISSEEFLPYLKTNEAYFSAYILQNSQQFFTGDYNVPDNTSQMILNVDDLSLARSPGNKERILDWARHMRFWHEKFINPTYVDENILVYNASNPNKVPIYAISNLSQDAKPGLVKYQTTMLDNSVIKIDLEFNILGAENKFLSSQFNFENNGHKIKSIALPWGYGLIHPNELINKKITLSYYLDAPVKYDLLTYQIVEIDGVYTLDSTSTAYQVNKKVEALSEVITLYHEPAE